MSKTAAMTLGLVLTFFGAELFLVKSWLLNPTATRIFNENFADNNGSYFNGNGGGLFGGNTGGSGITRYANSTSRPPGQSWPYYRTDQAGYNSGSGGIFSNGSYRTPGSSFISSPDVGRMDMTGRQLFVPPSWIMWPVLFVGAIFFLYGVSLR